MSEPTDKDELLKGIEYLREYFRQHPTETGVDFWMGYVCGTALKLQTERDTLIEKLIKSVDVVYRRCANSSDLDIALAGGATVQAFCDILQVMRIRYDPITGQREEIK